MSAPTTGTVRAVVLTGLDAENYKLMEQRLATLTAENARLREDAERLVREAYREGWYDNADRTSWDFGKETNAYMERGEQRDWESSEARAALDTARAQGRP